MKFLVAEEPRPQLNISEKMKLKFVSHPAWHLVSICLSVVVVEDHDGGDHTAGHHEHDAVEVGSWGYFSISSPCTYHDIMTDYERKGKELLIPTKV